MPRAVDTNVLVRILVDDGTEQADRARQRFVTEEVFVPSSVLLETEWVLRSHLGLDRKALNDLLTAVARAPAMQLENRTQMLQQSTRTAGARTSPMLFTFSPPLPVMGSTVSTHCFGARQRS